MTLYRMLKEFHTQTNPTILYRICMVCVIAFISVITVNAQSRVEIGIRSGISYYMGDLNPQNQFNNPGYQIGGILRYAYTDRIAFKATGSLINLNFAYPDNNIVLPTVNTHYSGNKHLVEFTGETELNFLSYDHPFIKKTKFTPYLSLGLGTTIYKRINTDSENYSNEIVFILSLPFGIGFKYKINDWIRVGAEWSFRKTFVDDLDYSSNSEYDKPDSPYGFEKTSRFNNTDIYSFAGFMVTFNLIKRDTECKSGF